MEINQRNIDNNIKCKNMKNYKKAVIIDLSKKIFHPS